MWKKMGEKKLGNVRVVRASSLPVAAPFALTIEITQNRGFAL
jgi:hypothetical protein